MAPKRLSPSASAPLLTAATVLPELASLFEEVGVSLDRASTHVFMCGNPAMIGLPKEDEETGEFEVVAALPVVIDRDVEPAADVIRPQLALYMGGMGARSANFHFEAVARAGWEAEATKFQELYLAGHGHDDIPRQRSRPAAADPRRTAALGARGERRVHQEVAGYAFQMPDICDLILDEHRYFRTAFGELYDARDREPEVLERRWGTLAAVFERHAAAEEEIFYPALLPRGDDAVEETLDAIKDHNAIRDAVKDAESRPVGSDPWWEAVGRARDENDEHMEEEESDGLPDFRANSEPKLRDDLGDRFLAFNAAHPCAEGVDMADKDPDQYVRAHSGPAGG